MIKRLWSSRKPKGSQLRKNKKLTYDYGIENPVKKLNEVIEMEIIAEEAVRLDDGGHTGVITGVEFRDDPYRYTDIVIMEDKKKIEIKCGVPSKITEFSGLGIILENFGEKIVVDKKYDPEAILKGKKVTFVTVMNKTAKGTFCNVTPSSLKPTK